MAETAEVNIGLRRSLAIHMKKPNLFNAVAMRKNAAPGQSCPNSDRFWSYVLPLKNSGNKRKGDEAKHDRG